MRAFPHEEMGTAALEAAGREAEETPRPSARRAASGGHRSRVKRSDAYLVALAAGVAALATCVASYMWEARQHASQEWLQQDAPHP